MYQYIPAAITADIKLWLDATMHCVIVVSGEALAMAKAPCYTNNYFLAQSEVWSHDITYSYRDFELK